MNVRVYTYVGPLAIRDAVVTEVSGVTIRSCNDLAAWLITNPTDRSLDDCWIATFTVTVDGSLHLASRRSEHVACAGGGPVLSAGEITFDADFEVVEISNQSTGFCPEPESWPAVEAVLDRIGLRHPGHFTAPIIFRRCPACGECNIVKDDWYYCQLCDAALPKLWNFTSQEAEQ